MSAGKIFTTAGWESQSEFHYKPLVFHIHHALPKRLKQTLCTNIKRHGGQVADLNEEDPPPDYVLIDAQSSEGQNFERQWLERGAPPDAFVSWTYVTACICEDKLVDRSVVQNLHPALIDPESQQPLFVNINSSLDGLAKASLVEKIGRHGGLVVSRANDPRVILCHPTSSKYKDLHQKFTKPNDPFVEMPAWLNQCVRQGYVTFEARKQQPRSQDQRQDFTLEDRDHLVAYIGRVCPVHVPYKSSRSAPRIFKDLVTDPAKYPWAANHTWQSWRERYLKFKDEMDPLINKWVKRNRAKSRDGDSTPNQLISSTRSRTPLASGLPQWMERDMEFDSEDDGVMPEPTGLSNERRPALRKRKAFDDAEVEVAKSSRPKLNSTESSDMRTHDDMRVQLGSDMMQGMSTMTNAPASVDSDPAQGTSMESGPHESSLSHSNSGSPSIPEFPQIRAASSPPFPPVEVHKSASDQLMSPKTTTASSANTPRNGGLKSEGSVFWSSSPRSMNSIVSKARQKTPSIRRMRTRSESVQNGLESPDPPASDDTTSAGSVMEAGETTEEDDDDDDAEVQDLLTSPLRAPSVEGPGSATPTVTRSMSAQPQPDSRRYTFEEKGKAKVVLEPTPVPSDGKADSDDDTDGVQTQAMLAFRRKAISKPADVQLADADTTEDDDEAKSEPGVMTQAMMAHRQRAIGASDLQGHATEATTDENEPDVQYGQLTQVMRAHREKAIAASGRRHSPASDMGGGDGQNEDDAVDEGEASIADGTTNGGHSARTSSSRDRVSVSNSKASLQRQLVPTLHPSHRQPQDNVPEIVAATSFSPPAPASRIPPAFDNIHNRDIAKALARMARRFKFTPEEVLDTFNFFTRDLQKTKNLLQRNREFLDDQSQNETLG